MDTQFYEWLTQNLRDSAEWEKRAAATTYGAADLDSKSRFDLMLFDNIKQASLANFAKSPFGKGLLTAGGAAIPATAAGGYLLHRGGEESRETVEDMRNKAIQTALALGGVGAGLMAAQRFSQPAGTKQGSANDETVIEKIATVGALDVYLGYTEEHGDTESVRQDASEMRKLNAEHGIDLFKQLL